MNGFPLMLTLGSETQLIVHGRLRAYVLSPEAADGFRSKAPGVSSTVSTISASGSEPAYAVRAISSKSPQDGQ